MNIECILKREGGTHVKIGKADYHFAPQPDGAHVADVQDDEHVQRFLGIPEAYKIYRGENKAAIEGDHDGDGDTDRDDLVIAYEQKFGKKPHYRMSAAKIKEALAAE